MGTASRLIPRYPFLEGVDPGTRALLDALPVVEVPAGTTLFDEGQSCRGFPMVLAGGVRVCKGSATGREIQLYRVEPGESCILTSGCLLGSVPYSARGVADSGASLVLLPPALFARLVADHPPFRAYVFGLFGERVAELMQLVEEVAFRKLDQRLAALLAARGRVVHATHQELADELGSVREIVSRVLKGFADRGMVALSREQIEVLDPRALAEAAGAQR